MAYVADLSAAANNNLYFRDVKYTTPNGQLQLVLMSLWPNEQIGAEIHETATQFIYVNKGEALAILDGSEYLLYPGAAAVVNPGTEHNIINTSSSNILELTIIYTPALHPPTEKTWTSPAGEQSRFMNRPKQPIQQIQVTPRIAAVTASSARRRRRSSMAPSPQAIAYPVNGDSPAFASWSSSASSSSGSPYARPTYVKTATPLTSSQTSRASTASSRASTADSWSDASWSSSASASPSYPEMFKFSTSPQKDNRNYYGYGTQ